MKRAGSSPIMGFVLRHTISKKTATKEEINPRPPIAMARAASAGLRNTITGDRAKKKIESSCEENDG